MKQTSNLVGGQNGQWFFASHVIVWDRHSGLWFDPTLGLQGTNPDSFHDNTLYNMEHNRVEKKYTRGQAEVTYNEQTGKYSITSSEPTEEKSE